MKLEKFIENLKTILEKESKSYELWIFGSYLNKDDYNDIDIGVIVHDEIKQSLITKINSIDKSLLVETAVNYGPRKFVNHQFHVVLFSTNDFNKLPIGNSVRKGNRIIKIAA